MLIKMSWLIVLCIFANFIIADSATLVGIKHRSNVLLQHAVKTLTGYKDVPKDDEGVVSNTNNEKVIPKYMMDLYERFKDRNVPTGDALANTVRSINSDIGMVDDVSLFIFNMSTIESEETVFNGDIHIYKKRKRYHSDIVVTLYELAPYYMTELGKYRLDKSGTGWQVFPVTSAVKSCLATRRPSPHILALRFSKVGQGENGKATTRSLHMKGFTRHLSRPYLVVYSNSATNITEDHVYPRMQLNSETNTFINPENGRTERFRKLPPRNKVVEKQPQQHKDTGNKVVEKQQKQQQKVKQSDNTTYQKHVPVSSQKTASVVKQPITQQKQSPKVVSNDRKTYKQELLQRKLSQQRKTNEVIGSRGKRSIYNNEIPADPNEPRNNKNEITEQEKQEKNNDKKTQRKKSHHHRSNHKRHRTFKMSDFDMYDQSINYKTQYLPYPKDYDTKKKRRRKQLLPSKNTQKGSGNNNNNNLLPFPEEWGLSDSDSLFNSNVVSSSSSNKQTGNNKLCRKRKLVLDFADIGWSDWVIAPKSFESNFCAGGCPFPQSQGINGLSNHATLQSLVQAVGINKDVPTPCCVPGRMTSLSVLYFDQHKNVVLKNYPNMSVQTCECQ